MPRMLRLLLRVSTTGSILSLLCVMGPDMGCTCPHPGPAGKRPLDSPACSAVASTALFILAGSSASTPWGPQPRFHVLQTLHANEVTGPTGGDPSGLGMTCLRTKSPRVTTQRPTGAVGGKALLGPYEGLKGCEPRTHPPSFAAAPSPRKAPPTPFWTG